MFRDDFRPLEGVMRLLHKGDCLNAYWFLSLADAQDKLERWRRDYNEVTPHGAIGNKPPIALLNIIGSSGLPMVDEQENSSFS